jgi:hypothetical protein
MKRLAPVLLGLVAVLAVGVPTASATACVTPTCTMTDGAAVASVAVNDQAGMYQWTVDGVNLLYQQWFWYSIGGSQTNPINALGLVSADQATPDVLNLTYQNAQLQVAVKYSLTDISNPATGHVSSDISEVIKVKNVSAVSEDVAFFQYSDFDLASNFQDTVQLKNSNTVDQKPNIGSLVLAETVATPSPDRYELSTFPNTVNELNGLNSNFHLANANTGPYPSASVSGDTTWAFEWDRTLGSGEGFTISKDKNLSGFVPEPTALLLFGGCLLFIGRKMQSRVKL